MSRIQRNNKQASIIERKLQFPKCTEIYRECIGREEPCNTCPYKEGWKIKRNK